MSAEELPSHPQLCVGWLCAVGMSVSLNMSDFLEWLCMAAAAWTAHLGICLCQCPLFLSLLHTHPTRLTHHACKHGHACCLHPVSVLLLIGVCLVFFLYLLIFSHPRKRILFFPLSIFGGKASEWRQADRLTQGSGGSCATTSLPGHGWWYVHFSSFQFPFLSLSPSLTFQLIAKPQQSGWQHVNRNFT